jgi:hypothetical protein
MAKSKKTKKVEEVIDNTQLEPIGEISLRQPEKLENCEWCFQFDEDEPQVFAWTGEADNLDEEPKVIFTITNAENSYITFTHKNGKSFKLFARELTDEGKQLRAKQIELTKANLQNESTNKEN